MLVPQKSELLHLKLQAALRDNSFPEEELKYLGIREDAEGTANHWYLVANEYEVPVTDIEEFEQVS